MKINQAPRSIWRDPLQFIAFGFGAGAFPFAPGTAGTLVAIPIYFLMQHWPWWLYGITLLLGFFIGCWLCQQTENAIKQHDHSGIVFDEIIGYLATMWLAPSGWGWVVMGFVLFRLFDIIKPWPINYLEKRFANGFGTMLDDVLAAIPSWLILQLMVYLWRS